MSHPRQVGKTLRNRYKIIQQLGSGGFGDTYLAVDLDLPGQPQCVVKHLKSKDLNPAILPIAKSLFDREAQFLYQMGSENNQIPKLFAHFEENGEFYLVQEFIDGHDLTKEIAPGKRLNEGEVLNLLKDILEVLTFVHQHNAIHRDIKPQNLMRRRKDGKIVLIDFGAVKEIGTLEVNTEGQTSVTVAVGSSGYMPPEQANGRPRLSSDIYAVGMLSIQAMTGLRPKELPIDPNTEEVIWRQFARVSNPLADVLDTMVRNHFSQRYQSAMVALQALIATGLPLLPPSELSELSATNSTVVIPSLPPSPVGSKPTQPAATPSLQIDLSPSTQSPTPLIRDPLSALQPAISTPLTSLKKSRWLIGVSIAAALVITFFSFVFGQNRKTQPGSLLNSHTPSRIDLYKKGLEKYKEGDAQGAIEDYNQAIKIDPNYALAYDHRGLARFKIGDRKGAIEDYNQAIKINPNDALAYDSRGNARFTRQDKKGATEDFNQAIQINPNYALAYYHRGSLRSDLGDKKGAIDDFNQAIQINPNYTVAYYHRGNARFDLGDKKAAIDDFNQTLKIDSNNALAYYHRGNARFDLGDKKGAIEDFNQTLKIAPNNVLAYYQRGNARFEGGDTQGAIEDYTQVIKIHPNNALAYYQRGNAHSGLGDRQGAIKDYQKAASLYHKQGKLEDQEYYQSVLDKLKQLQP